MFALFFSCDADGLCSSTPFYCSFVPRLCSQPFKTGGREANSAEDLPLLPGWKSAQTESGKGEGKRKKKKNMPKTYYYHEETHETRWDPPIDVDAALSNDNQDESAITGVDRYCVLERPLFGEGSRWRFCQI